MLPAVSRLVDTSSLFWPTFATSVDCRLTPLRPTAGILSGSFAG